MSALDDVAAAAARRDAAAAALVDAVAAAKADGEEIAGIARAAGVGRQTIYRWLTNRGTAAPVTVWTALDDGLVILADLVSADTRGQVTAALSSRDVRVKLRRWDLGWKNITPGAQHDLDDQERAVLDLAGKVAGKVQRAIAAGADPLPHVVFID